MSLNGKKVSEFTADAYLNGEFIKVSDKDLQGKWSVLFFYPADFTFVCPTELEDLQRLYGDFKKDLAEVVANFLTAFQTKYNAITDAQAHEVLAEGAQKARELAAAKMEHVKRVVGIGR